MFTESTNYIGRFAPSPTGPLHFGSLIAAVASYCDAKANNGQWLLRMEDLDKPRELKGASDDILRTLDAFGFAWDGAVEYQSQRTAEYEHALHTLKRNNVIYACTCSRKEIADSAIASGIEGAIYPRTCYLKENVTQNASPSIHAAYRAVVIDKKYDFLDAILGKISQNLVRDVGDFIVKRADGLFAYQLAVVVDDAAQNVTHIVRGADLLNSTPRQIYLQQLLGFPTPQYAHIPVAVNAQNEKLSKQTLAAAIAPEAASMLVLAALDFLGQLPPAEIKNAKSNDISLNDIWRWAIANWNISNVPKQRQITTQNQD